MTPQERQADLDRRFPPWYADLEVPVVKKVEIVYSVVGYKEGFQDGWQTHDSLGRKKEKSK